jgi:hypothetical protein
MKKITKVLLVLFCCAYAQTSFAQASDKLFKSHGFTIQWSKIPIEATDFIGGSYEDRLNYLGVGYGLDLRFTLAQLGDNASLGLSASLIAALDCTVGGQSFLYEDAYGSVYVPVHLNYNIGAGATYDSDSDFGFGIGLGLTPSYLPIVGGEDLSELRLSPSVKLSLRYYKSGTNSLSEYFIRVDKLPDNIELSTIENDSFPMTFTIGRTKVIGY